MLGILVAAKKGGQVPRVAPLIDQLERQIGFRISKTVRQQILNQAGE